MFESRISDAPTHLNNGLLNEGVILANCNEVVNLAVLGAFTLLFLEGEYSKILLLEIGTHCIGQHDSESLESGMR